MKKIKIIKIIKIIIMFVFLEVSIHANEFNGYIGIDGWRHDTGIEDSGDPGWNIGAEYLFSIKEDVFYFGGGLEYKSKMKEFDDDSDYSPMIAFLKGKLFIGNSDFYLHGRGGYSYNDNGDNPVDNGPYIAAGLGYDFTKLYLELIYELFDINDNGELFNNGTMQMVGVKIGYKF